MDFNDFKEKFAEAIEVEDLDNLNESTEFRSLPEWGSLATLSIVSMMEDECDTEITTAQLREAKTLGDLFNLIEK